MPCRQVQIQRSLRTGKILAVEGDTGSPKRRFLIRWAGYGPEEDSWEPRENVSPSAIKEFLLANGLYDHNWNGARCPHCDKPCKNMHGVKIHLHSCRWKPEPGQNFAGTRAAAKVKLDKLSEAQKSKSKVFCEVSELRNVFKFKYLGSIFAADGDQSHDVQRRIALATSRMGQLRHVFNANIGLRLKMKLYKTAVCPLLTYGSEAWYLDQETIAMINGANARLLSRITGKDAHVEASVRTRSYDLVGAIRKRRLKWLGHILRQQGPRLIKLAVKVQYDKLTRHIQQQQDRRRSKRISTTQHQSAVMGNLFLDVPSGYTFEQLVDAAQDRDRWRTLTDTGRLPPPKWPRSSGATFPPPPMITSNRSEAEKYRSRDVHEGFLRPATIQTKIKRWDNAKTKKRKKESKGLTDKQRRAEAHAHFIVHHGSATNASQFLQIKSNCNNISADTLNSLRRMTKCPPPSPQLATTTITPLPTPAEKRTLPTWKEAEAAVFSSSS